MDLFMTSNKTERLIIRLSPELKKLLQIAADKDTRSMSSLIEKLIKDYLDKENITLKNP
jgi:predicted transcriptional regulator